MWIGCVTVYVNAHSPFILPQAVRKVSDVPKVSIELEIRTRNSNPEFEH